MEQGFAISIDVMLGLACDIERSITDPGGFRPADRDLGANKRLFGDVRIEGFIAALTTGAVKHLVIAGGDEQRYKGEEPVVNRAEVIRTILIARGISPEQVTAIPSNSNTTGNIVAFKAMVESRGLDLSRAGLSTNLYHLGRALAMAHMTGIPMLGVAAEGYWLLAAQSTEERKTRQSMLARMMGGGDLADRYVAEVNGFADMIGGSYKPRQDVAAVQDSSRTVA